MRPKSAVENSNGNSAKHTNNSSIGVRPRCRLDRRRLGLSAWYAAYLFKRRDHGSHAEHTQGGGIGLSIVRWLCVLYGRDVRIMPGAERGVVAKLRFAAGGW